MTYHVLIQSKDEFFKLIEDYRPTRPTMALQFYTQNFTDEKPFYEREIIYYGFIAVIKDYEFNIIHISPFNHPMTFEEFILIKNLSC